MIMKLSINKNIALSIILGIFTLLIINRITPPWIDPVIKLTISKNRVGINNIHQERNIEFTKEVMVDVLDLAHKSRFRHSRLGDIGYVDNFFVDISKSFTVKTAGKYRFNVSSDDGFSLSIDGKRLCEHVGDRPLTLQSCPLELSKGEHQFELIYFQGFGNAGLKVDYLNELDKKVYVFGENSKHLNFD